MKTKHIKLLVIIASVVIAGIFAFKKSTDSGDAGELTIASGTETAGPGSGETEESVTDLSEYTAYICGEVKTPGVYRVNAGGRISELVEKAGGVTEDADMTSVNLAREVTDGEQIIIGSLKSGAASAGGEQTPGAGAVVSAEGSLVNINTADKARLMTLPGIGEVRAEAIISYRNENGSFKTKEDIKKVSGIKEGSFEKIRDLITV